ncbi:MAG: hypothetical protein JWQ43_3782 [Glaciihabitans sp.]|nr:hypothetical protein [Glaciihabitans sp.]
MTDGSSSRTGSRSTGSRSTGSRILSRTPQASTLAIGTALAHAFLAADDWTEPALSRAGVAVLASRRRWLAPVIREILPRFPRPPRDSARELAEAIASCQPLVVAAERARHRGKPIHVVHRPGAPATATGTLPSLPTLNGLADLAALLQLTPGELDWFADTGHWNRRAASGRLQHYQYEWRQRPGRVPRLLEVPGQRLRTAQRAVLANILQLLPVDVAAHGFVPGRSAITGAAKHSGSEVVISLDLAAFFAHVTAPRVYAVFRRAGLPEAVAHTLTGLCTHAVPPRIISAMPPGGDAAERFALRKALAASHLPQGAPTSPALANQSLRRLDARLAGWAEATSATYTRYADDLAFSGGAPLVRRADAFVLGVGRIVDDEGHTLNAAKTRVRGASVRQSVTGIVVNQHPNTPRREFDALRAILHNCAVHGPASQNHTGHTDFRAHLLGRISWTGALNASRGNRLRAEFDRIQW